MKTSRITIVYLSVILFTCGCSEKRTPPFTKLNMQTVFPKVDKGSSEKYNGTVWHQGLVFKDSIFDLVSGTTSYEPGARSNWHSHPSGQILIVIDGKGYHQLKGEPKQVITKGEVIKCPPNVPHWDGGTEDTGMSHIYIVPNTDNGIVDWLGPVTAEEYQAK